MTSINRISVAAIIAVSALAGTFATASSAFAKDTTVTTCCNMPCCKPGASCCPTTAAAKAKSVAAAKTSAKIAAKPVAVKTAPRS